MHAHLCACAHTHARHQAHAHHQALGWTGDWPVHYPRLFPGQPIMRTPFISFLTLMRKLWCELAWRHLQTSAWTCASPSAYCCIFCVQARVRQRKVQAAQRALQMNVPLQSLNSSPSFPGGGLNVLDLTTGLSLHPSIQVRAVCMQVQQAHV